MMAPGMRAEAWLRDRLHAPDLFAGVTTADERRERVRRAILENGLARECATHTQARGRETWAELFARVYGQPLIAPEVAAA